MGAGVFIDHATGVVIDEQAAVSDDAHSARRTLGATGKTSRRHPHVGSGYTLGSGLSVLGPIPSATAQPSALGLVTKDVEAGAVDTSMSNRCGAQRKVAIS